MRPTEKEEDEKMKYIVEVNAKYLVSVEAESLCNAEHKLLDYDGVWGAMAYDRDMMKTDTFAGAVQGCEMVSMSELAAMVTEMNDAKQEAVKAVDAMNEATAKVAELEKALSAAKRAMTEAALAKNEAVREYDRKAERLGKQRN